MFTSIIVPMDGTPFSRQALPLALALARRSAATVHLVHVREPETLRGGGAPFVDPQLDNDRHRDIHETLQLLAAELSRRNSLHVDAVALVGAPGAELAQFAGGTRADLVIMMSHARGGLARAWLGSVADELVQHLSVPLLLVPPGADSSTEPREPLFSIVLVPLDGSDMADEMLQYATSLATPHKTAFTLLTVVEPPAESAFPDLIASIAFDPNALDDEKRNAEAHLTARATELRKRGARVDTLVLTHAKPAQAILDAAEACHADSIALCTHGRGAIRRRLLGSIADEVVRHAKVPVLVYRPERNRG